MVSVPITGFFAIPAGKNKPERTGHGSMGERAYNGGLAAVPPTGPRDRAHGQGVRVQSPPEAPWSEGPGGKAP